VDALIRSQLIHLFDYDKYLAASLETATNPAVINFAMILAKIYLIDDRYLLVIGHEKQFCAAGADPAHGRQK
jgi:hypothetical protein